MTPDDDRQWAAINRSIAPQMTIGTADMIGKRHPRGLFSSLGRNNFFICDFCRDVR